MKGDYLKTMKLANFDLVALEKLHKESIQEFTSIEEQKLKLNMARGKPSAAQLALSGGLLNMPIEDTMDDGVEARNYGELMGLHSCRKLFAELLNVKYEQVFVGGNSSLTLMYDTIAKAYTHGLLYSDKPWSQLDQVSFICPVPGYDRHFAISETFGMKMIPVALLDDGPDMNEVERLVRDENVKGMWCVPKYSNPTGAVYSEETINRIANLKPAAKDFILMWDNAYCVHDLYNVTAPEVDIISVCEQAGNADMPFEFASTSKMTFPGSGVACFACSEANMNYMKKLITAQSISYDKINQLRHVLFFKDKEGVVEHMKKHAEILRPKFDLVDRILTEEIGDLDIASWSKPEGGYFVSLNVLSGCAKRVHELCRKAGVVMTDAGATYPGKFDPDDSNLRIAPSFPSLEELERAMRILCICIKLAACEKLINKSM